MKPQSQPQGDFCFAGKTSAGIAWNTTHPTLPWQNELNCPTLSKETQLPPLCKQLKELDNSATVRSLQIACLCGYTAKR